MTQSSTSDAAWAIIDRERRRDRTIRRISIAAWGMTFVALLVFAAFTLQRVQMMRLRVAAGLQMPQMVFETAMPFVAVVGALSLLIGTLSTVGIFLRLRTASLAEIQLRLAVLEELLQAEGRDAAPGEPRR